jgi:ornithine cyclodeaminase/alanine dehydrogenase-like protein (mu-crystallin family)
MRILDAPAVEALIDDSLVLESIRDLFSLPDEPGEVGLARVDLEHPSGWLRSLPAYIRSRDLLGFKVLHRTAGVGMRYTIYVHSLETGELRGIVDGLEVTNLRTGAVSALASDHLARRDIDVAVVVGTGPVARGQLRAIELVRPSAEIRVFARTPENRRAFVVEMASFVSGRLVEADSLDGALDGAGLVTLATKATSPILFERHLQPGMHVNSVGPASRDRVEVDPALFTRFDRVVFDSAGLVLDEAGDAYLAVAEHGFEPGRAEELGSVVAGLAKGRATREEITLFKSVGTGAQDLIVASQLLDLAADAGVGTVVDDVNSIKPIVARH